MGPENVSLGSIWVTVEEFHRECLRELEKIKAATVASGAPC